MSRLKKSANFSAQLNSYSFVRYDSLSVRSAKIPTIVHGDGPGAWISRFKCSCLGFHVRKLEARESPPTIAHEQVAVAMSNKTNQTYFAPSLRSTIPALPRLRFQVMWRLMPSISLTKQPEGTSLGSVSISYPGSLPFWRMLTLPAKKGSVRVAAMTGDQAPSLFENSVQL